VTTQAQRDTDFLAYVREEVADEAKDKFFTVYFVADIMAAVDRVIAERDQARREINVLNRLHDEGGRLCAEAIAGLQRATNFAKRLNAMIDTLTAERDEARREVCINEANHLPTMADPHREARRRGWDCFKEER